MAMIRERFRRIFLHLGIVPLLLLTAFAGLTIYCGVRIQRMTWAFAILREHQVICRFAGRDEPYSQFNDAMPEKYPKILSVYLNSRDDIENIVPALVELGTVQELDYYDLTPQELRLLSEVKSIEIIRASWGGSVEEVRPFLSHNIRDYSVSGADWNIPHDSLELLYTIPSLKEIGMAHGPDAVPAKLRRQRPEIKIYVTDFPP